jgi:hypothetical protein
MIFIFLPERCLLFIVYLIIINNKAGFEKLSHAEGNKNLFYFNCLK